ncbi:3-methyladenine DNA glycosylase [Rhodobacteraceae bacterium WD3A24]|nr:3-methyladenine DNA glycosylase [Rhodobacteraceae bacterium WD3A24]
MRWIGLRAAMLALGVTGAASAQETAGEPGAVLYERYCRQCHGDAGQGDGPAAAPLAGVLSVEVPDLTRISQRNGGVFPMGEVIRIIDGRDGARAHGGAMPLWGSVFAAETAAEAGDRATLIDTRGRVLSLALFLETIQR